MVLGADPGKHLVNVDDPGPCLCWRRAVRQRVQAGPLDSKLGLVARRVKEFQLDLIADGDLAGQHLFPPPALDQLMALPCPDRAVKQLHQEARVRRMSSIASGVRSDQSISR